MKQTYHMVFIFCLQLFATFLSGVLGRVMWGWFVVPLGVPSITIAQSLGISLLLFLYTFKNNYNPNKEMDADKLVKQSYEITVHTFASIIAICIFGYIYHLFM